MAYLYYNGDRQTAKRSVYVVGIDSESRDFKFLKFNELIITADKQKINLGKAKRFDRRGENSVREALIYEVKKPILEKIANAKNVTVKVGNFSTKVGSDMLVMLKNMLNASE